jgi:molybdopterin converting factor small subunit
VTEPAGVLRLIPDYSGFFGEAAEMADKVKMFASEPTVEECLAELREMFPKRSVIVSAFLCPNEYSVAVASEDEHELFSYLTLSETMAAVRQWKKENKQ